MCENLLADNLNLYYNNRFLVVSFILMDRFVEIDKVSVIF
jgi:hypothetical protein